MVKVENLSKNQICLRFKSSSGSYTKRLESMSVIKLTSDQYNELVDPPAHIMEMLRVSRYNIVGSLPEKIELVNKTSARLSVNFARSPVDKYTKVIPPYRSLSVTEEEFEFVESLNPQIRVVRPNGERKAFFSSIKQNELKKDKEIEEV